MAVSPKFWGIYMCLLWSIFLYIIISIINDFSFYKRHKNVHCIVTQLYIICLQRQGQKIEVNPSTNIHSDKNIILYNSNTDLLGNIFYS